MKTTKTKQSGIEDSRLASRFKAKTVRGSGFTYSEEQLRTDLSIPIEKVDQEDIVPLPELGKKNRP